MELEGVKELSIFEELRSFLKGVMELEGVKELSHYSVLTFLPCGIIGI